MPKQDHPDNQSGMADGETITNETSRPSSATLVRLIKGWQKHLLLTEVCATIAVLVIGLIQFPPLFSPQQHLSEGTCIMRGKPANDVNPKEISCDDNAGTAWKIAAATTDSNGQGCDERYAYTITAYTNRILRTTVTYCLQPNLQPEQCYDDSTDRNRVPCGERGAVLRVVKQLPVEGGMCEPDQQPISLPGTGVTSCTARP